MEKAAVIVREPESALGNDLNDPLLAAAERAPLVPLTDHERALLAEVQGGSVTWVSTDDIMKKLAELQPIADAE
ncbi:MAG: hypothetical protein U0359_08510 [Byssovorax sp.]